MKDVKRLFDDEEDVENTICVDCPHDLICDIRCPALKYIIKHCIKNMREYEKWADEE